MPLCLAGVEYARFRLSYRNGRSEIHPGLALCECQPLHSFRSRLKRRKRVFPLVIRQLPDSAPVRMHREQFAVRLRSVIADQRFVLPPQARTAEDDPLAVWRPYSVGVVAACLRQSPHAGAVWSDCVDLEIAVSEAREIDKVPFRRPGWKVVVLRCQYGDLAVRQALKIGRASCRERV